MIGVDLAGAMELDNKLRNLEAKVGKKISRKAVRDGAKVIRDRAKQNARSLVGGKMGKLLAKYLTIRAWKRKYQKGGFGVSVQLSDKANEQFVSISKSGKRSYIPSAIEYGHAYAAPNPFMRKAFDEEKNKAANKIISSLKAGIEEEAKKK